MTKEPAFPPDPKRPFGTVSDPRDSLASHPEGDTDEGSELITSDELDCAIRAGAIFLRESPEVDYGSVAEDLLQRLSHSEALTQSTSRLVVDDQADFPQKLGTLTLLECLGSGGMGRVYRAIHPRLGRTQAVKILHADRLQNAEAVARFYQEIAAIGRLNHPNIVAAHHADEYGGIPYLVMEYVEGQSLSQLIRRMKTEGQSLSVGSAVNLILQAATGMAYAHAQGILHRDLKPSNLLIDGKGLVRVSDLGLARIRTPRDAGEHHSLTSELTAENTMMGTLDFMAPEQLRDSKSVDERADVYALAATLFYLLTQREVYPTGTSDVVSKITSILNDPLPTVRALRSDVPKGLDRVLARALAKDVNQRIGSMPELIQLLSPWSEELTDFLSGGETKKSVDSDLQVKPGRRPPRRWAAVLSGLAVIILALLSLGVILRLTLPGEGTLIVESSDPNITVSVRQLNGPAVKSMEISQGINQPFRLRAGIWEIEVTGNEGDRFRVTPDRVEIGRNAETTIRIEREPASPSSINSSIGQSVTPLENNSIAPLEDGNWMPGELTTTSRGLVAQPTKLDSLFDWQILPLRTATGMWQMPEQQFPSDLDPQGELIAWTTGDHVVIVNIATSKVVQIFQSSNAMSVGWQSVRFSPSGDKIALISRYGDNVEIRRRDGRLLSAWRNARGYYDTADWLSDERHLLFTSDSELAIVDLSGKVDSRWNPDSGFAKILQGEVHHSMDGAILFLAADGKLRTWNPTNNEIGVLITLEDWESGLKSEQSAGFSQNSDGTQILTWQGVSVARSVLWNTEGRALAKVNEHLFYVAWSPDGQYIVDGGRKIREAKTLSTVKQLNLDASDSLATSQLIPYWPKEDEINFLTGRSLDWRSEVGAIRRFHPAGRQLDTFEFPRPLGPLSATFNPDGTISAFYGDRSTNAAIVNWSTAPSSAVMYKTSAGPPNFNEVAWNIHNGRILAPAHWLTSSMFDRNGAIVKSFDDLQARSPTWSPDGTQYTLTLPGTTIHLYSSTQHQTEWQSPRYDHVSEPSWSRDGRWLAYSSSNIDWSEDRIHIVDLQHPDRVIHDFHVSDHDHYAYPLQFSPDGKWLAACRADPKLSQTASEIVLIRLQDMKEFRQSIETSAHTHHLVWSDDALGFRTGDHFTSIVGLSMETKPLAPNSNREMPLCFFLAPNRWLTFGRSDGYIEDSSGSVIGRLPLGLRPVSAHNNDGQAQIRFKNQILFLSGLNHAPVLSVVSVCDFVAGRILQNQIAFEDGAAISVNTAGTLLLSPQNIDRYVAHLIVYPGGRKVAVPRSELLRRAVATADQKAVLWAHDLTAKILGSLDNALPLDPSKVESLPTSGSIQTLDFSKIQEISDGELIQLSQFARLNRLDLSETPIQNLPSLTSLEQLEILNLSGTRVDNIDAFNKHPRLLEVDLSRTPITASSLEFIQFENLRSLDLSYTDLDPFALLYLRGLPSLRQLKLIGVELTETDLQPLRTALPDCVIVTEPEKAPSP